MLFRLFVLLFDFLLVPAKWMAGKIVSEITYNVLSGSLNPTLSVCLSVVSKSVNERNIWPKLDSKLQTWYL